MRTLRSVRKFKPDPVEEEKILLALRYATFAPNGSNSQPWRFFVVKDLQKKKMIRDIALKAHLQIMSYLRGSRSISIYRDGKELAESLPDVPVLVFVFADPKAFTSKLEGIAKIAVSLHLPNAWRHVNLILAASIYPAIQNFLLAAKGLGLASCITTSIILKENEVSRILHVPRDWRLFALVYLGYPKVPLQPPKREPVERFTFYDEWRSAGD